MPITAAIMLRKTPPVWYGDKVYIIVRNGNKVFREPCPVCDDTKKINVRGFELKCPYCDVHPNDNTNTLVLCRHVVEEVFVNQIVIEGPVEKGAYKRYMSGDPRGNDCPTIKRVLGFYKHGNGYGSERVVTIPTWEGAYDPDEEVLQKAISGQKTGTFTDYVFSDRKGAERALAMQEEYDRELLRKFNEEHGTNHEYPW